MNKLLIISSLLTVNLIAASIDFGIITSDFIIGFNGC